MFRDNANKFLGFAHSTGVRNISITTMPWGKQRTVSGFLKVLAEIREAGYNGVGIEKRLLPRPLLTNPRRLGNILARTGISNAGSYSPMKREDVVWARESGTPILWVVVRERDCDRALEGLAEFTRLASQHGVVAALHNHLRTCFEDEGQIGMALEHVQGLRLCLDTAHGVAAGMDIEGFISSYGDRVALVHLKDLKGRMPKHKVRFRRDFVNVGRGVLDFGSIIRALDAAGYSGSLMVEVEALEGAAPLDVAREAYNYLVSLV